MIALAMLLVLVVPAPALARGPLPPELIETVVPAAPEEELEAPDQVQIEPGARDDEIAARLQRILEATDWFVQPQVTVREGVVFLEGSTDQSEYRTWAGDLARSTQDVVAVVNRIEVLELSPWDFSPAFEEINRLARGFVLALPQLGFGVLILVVTFLLATLAVRGARRLLRRRVENPLLRDVSARLLALPVLLIGIYVVLQAFGLTRLALTVLGGTGLAGLVIGIAFSDIVENFLASILISLRRPFDSGDLIRVADNLGVVQRVTTRGTVLMGVDGNHIQIPNATIYKSNIINYTANPKRRLDFVVGIGYEDAIADAQEAVLAVLTSHPVVLPQPEPLVLAENLGPSTVDLRVYFWIDGNQHDVLKVKSSVMRLTKRTLQSGGFSLPDPAREVIFPQGVPLRSAQEPVELQRPIPEPGRRPRPVIEPARGEPISTAAEGELGSEDEKIREQARDARVPEQGTDLLQRP